MQSPSFNPLLRFVFCACVLIYGAASFTHAANSNSKSGRPASRSAAAAKVDLNTADATAFEALPGVGPVTARAIMAARPFSSVAELESVQGIGAAKLSELRDRVTVTRTAKGKKSEAPGKEIAATKSAGKGKSGGADTVKSRKAAAAGKTSAGRVDLNTADGTSLEALPGVGPVTAQAIIKARPFASVDDLSRVPGIGDAKLAALRDQVTVSGRPAAKQTRQIKSAPEPVLEPTGRPSARSGAAPTAASGRTNLNTATREELEALPEIGPVKAQAIIDARPFSTVEDVMRVKGIKEGTFEAIRDRITVR